MCAAESISFGHRSQEEGRIRLAGIALTTLGGLRFAIDASTIRGILDAPTPSPANHTKTEPTEPTIDLAALFGAPVPGGRRAIRLSGSQGSFLVLAGANVHVVQVPFSQLRGLPPFLEGLHARVGIMGLVEIEGAFGYLLDVHRLSERTE